MPSSVKYSIRHILVKEVEGYLNIRQHFMNIQKEFAKPVFLHLKSPGHQILHW